MASNGNTRGGAGGRGGANSGFRSGQQHHAGGRGGGNAGQRGGGPPHASRWGNGPPSTTSSGTNTPSHAQQRNVPSARPPVEKRISQTNNTSNAFPSLGAASAKDDSSKLMHDRIMFLLVTLIGNPVTVTVKSGSRFFGIFSAANTEGGELSIALSSAQQILPAKDKEAQPELGGLKATLLINYKDLESVEGDEVRMHEQAKEMREAREKEAFRTDTEISKAFDPLASGRTLQKWSDDPDLDELDGPGSKLPAWATPYDASGGLEERDPTKGWDQFAANEARFGIKSNYDDNLYTTKLDRSGKDFREREREADRIAREIMGQATNNPHLAEERGQADDSGVNEEDKYGAVVRNPNAYVPPALRKQMAAASTAGGGKKVTANAPASMPASVQPTATKVNGAPPTAAPAAIPAPAPPATQTSTEAAITVPPPPVAVNLPTVNVKVPSPSFPQETNTKDTSGKKPSIDASNPLMGDFRSFVSSERERLEKKKAALAKKEKDTRLADLKSWASTFKLNTPMPSDVADMVHKDKADGASEKPRDPSLQKSLSPTPSHSAAAAPSSKADASRSAATSRAAQASSSVVSPAGGSGSAQVNKDAQKLAESKAMLQKMTIPKIPPFNPDKFKARQAAAAAGTNGTTGDNSDASKGAARPDGGMPSSVSTSSFKLSAKASSFKPFNPNAASFTPGGAVATTFTPAAAAAVPSSGSPAYTAATPSLSARPSLTSTPPVASTSAVAAPANPFFGNKVIKKSIGTLHIREDFNPFKVNKVPDAKSVGPMWAFSGKPYRQHFVVPPPGGVLDDGSGLFVPGMIQPGLHPGAQAPQPVPQSIHPAQMPMPTQQSGAGPAGPGPIPTPGPAPGPGPQQQPFGMVYQPYAGAPYQYAGGQPAPGGGMGPQGRVPMQMPNAPGPHMSPYGAVPPPPPQQFMGQMPFSPHMHQHAGHGHGAPQNIYSPQMGPAGQVQQQGGYMSMPPGAGGPRLPPPHLQKGPTGPGPGQPPHMYYPGPGLQGAYGQPQFGQPPNSGGPQGGLNRQQQNAPPPGESAPASSAASPTA
ncbi:related to PBP1 - Pab1p interacting protein [Melanopsichium pennsylvanicum]|uniref:Related to PBP1 - Pab1p interacting protein n=2 Tax=Melanopsichium pennsylvanicum TaxID=63383 RepID=A0AAJ4XL80_9BASI|nr:related to PBP1-Pab1p interacting protein [Melanopsichium pennsylvanicum 4]SNX84352.1 related to PBP1 - Pab1p interacting protein [Melanopsichium pennsylvanicum]